ncbi:hypothetical protein [Micromonospora coerulea]|uniref:hypothetical protein n=1 Tax=Micromonospora coerulea TaxID=47856 RepID=UPI0019063205|nr:hypothetical protein [Micromonospora veneta]
MTTALTKLAAQERMTPDGYAVTAIAGDFAARGALSFERFLSGYYAESIRIIHEAHLTDCTIADGQHCATCNAIRVGLAGLDAEERVVTAGEVAGNAAH